MGLGAMSADGTHNPTSSINQHRSQGTDRPKQQNIFSTFVTLSIIGPGGMYFKCRHSMSSPGRWLPFYSLKWRIKILIQRGQNH